MVNWIAGNWPDRFRCLVNHDGVFDMRSMYFATEELWFPEWEHGGPYWANPEGHEKHNPALHVEKWKTPMLVVHGAIDFRIPESQGLAAFTALQRQGIPSRLLYYPGREPLGAQAEQLDPVAPGGAALARPVAGGPVGRAGGTIAMSSAARCLWLAALALLAAAGCARMSDPSPETVPAPGATFDLAAAEIIDLSHAYDADTLYWPTSPSRFELQVLAHGMTEGGYFYSANAISTPEHGGTHLDAPIHFAEQGWTTAEIPLERLIGPAVVIDISERAAADPDTRLDGEDLFDWEADHGLVPEGAIVLLRTGWSRRWPDPLAYLGDDTPGDASNLHFPAYGEEAARTLVEERKVAALGVDTASIDHGPSTDFIVHQIANGANVIGLENLTQLELVPDTGAWVVALPMKIAGGSGGPARVVALLPPAG